ncbi:L,D-transpeptidase [Candidatus Dojkabacteria bacterium]|nr:L,D-transpeptidase [Candidatus Dojkabacteria bacterium]
MRKILPLLFFNVVLIFIIGYFSFNINAVKKNASEREQKVSNQQILVSNETKSPEVLGIEPEEIDLVYPKIDLCYSGKCIALSTGIIEWIKEDKVKEEERIIDYMSSHIIPFFQKNFMKTSIAKNAKGSFMYFSSDKLPNLSNIGNQLTDKISTLETSDSDIRIDITGVDSPGTDGTYAKRYIEVDNSRQKLYSWIDGKVDKVIKLSGPKYGYQVYGVFPIVDKGIEPIAPGGKYMPYWMAFYYSPSQNSWYGLHALIWWHDRNNNKIYESLSSIGERRSSGCIRMLLDEAKYLYDNFERGDYVLIHE